MIPLLDIDGFVDALRLELEDEIDPSSIIPEARLIADLDLDSLQLLRVAAFVESLAPIILPDQLDPADATIGDLHHYYRTLAEHAAAEP